MEGSEPQGAGPRRGWGWGWGVGTCMVQPFCGQTGRRDTFVWETVPRVQVRLDSPPVCAKLLLSQVAQGKRVSGLGLRTCSE